LDSLQYYAGRLVGHFYISSGDLRDSLHGEPNIGQGGTTATFIAVNAALRSIRGPGSITSLIGNL
jgi:hypothetical protein